MPETYRERSTSPRPHLRIASRKKAQTPRPPDQSDHNFNAALRQEIAVAAWLLRQSVGKTWKDIRDGKLAVIREGGRTYVPGSEILRRSRL